MSRYPALDNIVMQIKERINISELIIADGIELEERGEELVGFHHNKSISKYSLTVNPRKGLYNCFGCSDGGDHFTWLMNNRNCSFQEALATLSNMAGVNIQEINNEEQQKYYELIQKKEKLFDLYTAAADMYHQQLTDDHLKLLYNKWGITKDTAVKYKIGYAPNGETFTRFGLKDLKFDSGLIFQSGLLKANGEGHFQDRIVFPYWKNDKVVFFIARLIGETSQDAKYKPGKYIKLLTHNEKNNHVSEAVANDYFLGEDSIIGAEKLIITEGVTDCYVALQENLNCISPATINFRKEDQAKLLSIAKRVKSVYICNDNEKNKSGEKGAITTAEYLESNGISVKLIKLPLQAGQDKIDLAEYLRDYGRDNFLDLMKEAKSLLEIDLERLRDDVDNGELFNTVLNRLSSINSETKREKWIKELKAVTGLNVTAIRKDIEKITKTRKAQPENESSGESKNQVDRLIHITKEKATLFHDEDNQGFARIQMQDHEETLNLDSKDFKYWLNNQFYNSTGKSPNSDAINQAINTLNAIAVHEGELNKLSLRVAKSNDIFWYDIANDEWQMVKITPYGWMVKDQSLALFRRYANTAPQVTPEHTDNHNLEMLNKYFNLKNKEDFVLMYACVASFLIPEIPHPAIIFYGDKGSAKTTAQRVIRKIVDPAKLETTFFPNDSRELALQLMNNYAPAFDNLDGLKNYQSDILCQAVTGGGTSRRKLYTDTDEVIIKFKRCIMLNGINLVAERDDLLDRSIIIRLDRISKDNRKEEAEFWNEFQEELPYILGSLFNVIAKAMEIHPNVKLDNLPRMADFARWGYALTEAMGISGDKFLNIYYDNIAKTNEEAVLSNMVSSAVLEFMEGRKSWKGTASVLFDELTNLDVSHEKDKNWVKNPQMLSREINMMSSALADQGIEVKKYREGNNRMIELLR